MVWHQDIDRQNLRHKDCRYRWSHHTLWVSSHYIDDCCLSRQQNCQNAWRWGHIMWPAGLTFGDLALKFSHCARSWWGIGMPNLVAICTVVFRYLRKSWGGGWWQPLQCERYSFSRKRAKLEHNFSILFYFTCSSRNGLCISRPLKMSRYFFSVGSRGLKTKL